MHPDHDHEDERRLSGGESDSPTAPEHTRRGDGESDQEERRRAEEDAADAPEDAAADARAGPVTFYIQM